MPSGSEPTLVIWSIPWRPHSRAALITSQGTPSVAVVLCRHRPDHLGREPPAGPLKLELIVVEPEIHVSVPDPAARVLTDQSIVPAAARRFATLRPEPTVETAGIQLSCARALVRFGAVLLLLALALGGCSLGDDRGDPPQLGVPGRRRAGRREARLPVHAPRATRVRVGGSDAAADAAGVAGALFPATGDSDRPTAVVLVDQDDWITGIAASALAGPPIGAPHPAHRRRRAAGGHGARRSSGWTRRAPTSRRMPR